MFSITLREEPEKFDLSAFFKLNADKQAVVRWWSLSGEPPDNPVAIESVHVTFKGNTPAEAARRVACRLDGPSGAAILWEPGYYVAKHDPHIVVTFTAITPLPLSDRHV